MIIGGIALLIFAIVALSTAKPSTFSCSRATKTCTWVHTNAIGWTSTETYPLDQLSNSHMYEHHDPRGRSAPSYVWVVDANPGYLELATAQEGEPIVRDYEAYANALQSFFDDPNRQTYGLTIDADPGEDNAFALLLVLGIGLAIGGFVWRRNMRRELVA